MVENCSLRVSHSIDEVFVFLGNMYRVVKQGRFSVKYESSGIKCFSRVLVF